MDPHSIVIRAANPTFGEGLVCARFLDEVAEGFFRFMLGRRFAEIIARAYTRPNHSYSFQNVIYAQYDKRIVGMALGFTAQQQDNFSDQPLREAAGLHVLRMKGVNILCAPMIRILQTIGRGDYYLLSMGVEKEFRGEGIGSMLMNRIEQEARASGSARLSLDVSAKNRGARRLYERYGMAVESQWPKRIPVPGLKFYRMAKSL